MKKITLLSFFLLSIFAFSPAKAQTTSCVGNASLTITIEDCTDVQDIITDTGIKLFPNPFNEGFNLILPNNLAVTNCQIKISDTAGRVLFNTNLIHENSLYISTAKLPPGMYIVNIIGNNASFQRKVLKH